MVKSSDYSLLLSALDQTGARPPALSITNLGKQYRRRKGLLSGGLFGRDIHRRDLPWALRNVDIALHAGQSIGIIGRNGSGKSTLLQLISGVLLPTEGRVQISGKIAALLELGAGFNPEFTGRENVLVNAAVMGLTRAETQQRLSHIFAFAEIGDAVDQPVKTYSSGMYVRLAFAVLTQVDADVIIVDEALAVGDIFFQQKCMRFFREFKQRGILFLVSHDTAAILNLCDQALWLENGYPKAYGTAREVCEQYVATAFGAGPGGNGRSRMMAASSGEIVDQRLAYINHSSIRNDIEVFPFYRLGQRFGRGGASIVRVQLENDDGARLSWIVGGELVTIAIDVHTETALTNPIVGFLVKDRLGQVLFSDNTFLSCNERPVAIESDTVFRTLFRFRMPILPAGDYSLATAVATGTQQDPVQLDWIESALSFKSHSSSVCTGLLGIPMLDIRIETVNHAKSH